MYLLLCLAASFEARRHGYAQHIPLQTQRASRTRKLKKKEEIEVKVKVVAVSQGHHVIRVPIATLSKRGFCTAVWD